MLQQVTIMGFVATIDAGRRRRRRLNQKKSTFVDFETIGAGQVGGVVVRTAGVGMGLGEQQRPAAGRGLRRESIDAGAVTGVKREMVQPRPEPVVAGRGEGGRLLDDEVGAAEPPAPAMLPVLELLVAELAEQPPPLLEGPGQVRYPQLDVMQASGHGVVHAPIPLPTALTEYAPHHHRRSRLTGCARTRRS